MTRRLAAILLGLLWRLWWRPPDRSHQHYACEAIGLDCWDETCDCHQGETP